MSGTVDGLVVFEAPADLAVLNARLPALFLPDAKASERFWEFSLWISETKTRGGHITERSAGSPTGAKDAGCSILGR
jgi:hypothetical protein